MSLTMTAGSLAKLIVYSMATDSLPVPPSGISTPFTPGSMTPVPESDNNLGDYLSASLGKKSKAKVQTYLAGSKALDSLAHLIASTESFFHPTNSGAWTADVRSEASSKSGSAHTTVSIVNGVHKIRRIRV